MNKQVGEEVALWDRRALRIVVRRWSVGWQQEHQLYKWSCSARTVGQAAPKIHQSVAGSQDWESPDDIDDSS